MPSALTWQPSVIQHLIAGLRDWIFKNKKNDSETIVYLEIIFIFKTKQKYVTNFYFYRKNISFIIYNKDVENYK